MLSTYTESITGGLLLFLVCAAVLLPVIAVVQRTRTGRSRPRRLLTHAGFLLYGAVAVALVFLPLPDSRHACYPGQTFQPVPFRWAADIEREAAQFSVHALTTPAALQLAFNVALFVPLGFALRRMYGRGPRTVLAAGFGTSLLIEITQLTGNFGVYACPYRIGDVDDLLANTFGAVLGCLIAIILAGRSSARRPSSGHDRAMPVPAAPGTPVPAARMAAHPGYQPNWFAPGTPGYPAKWQQPPRMTVTRRS